MLIYNIHPAAVRCDMMLHQAFRARLVQTTASAVRCDMVIQRVFLYETSKTRNVTTHLHREYLLRSTGAADPVYSVKDHHDLQNYSPLLLEHITCTRQVAIDKWSPL